MRHLLPPLLLVCLAVPALAEDAAPRVYTNADLAALPGGAAGVYTNGDVEALEPMPLTGMETVRVDPADWEFVNAVLDRERAKLEQDRQFELEQARVEAEAETEPETLLYYPYFPRYYRHRVGPLPGPRRHHDRPRSEEPAPIPETRVPHSRFQKDPPVREFRPGLGDSYRGWDGEGNRTDGARGRRSRR